MAPSIIEKIKSVFGAGKESTIDGHDPSQHDAMLKALDGATTFRYATREQDPQLFEALDKIAAFSKEKFSGYKQPGVPDIVVVDHLNDTDAEFFSRLGKNGTIAVTKDDLKSPSNELLYTMGHEWGHALIHTNNHIDKLVAKDARFHIPEHDKLAEEYTKSLKDFVYSLKPFSEKEKKDIYETLLSEQGREIFSDRASVLMTCDAKTPREMFTPEHPYGSLGQAIVEKLVDKIDADMQTHPPKDGKEDTQPELVARIKRLLKTEFTHPFNQDEAKFYSFPNDVPPGCPVPVQNTPAAPAPESGEKHH